ncbi:hypothetical protein VTL71DRAFT_9547, partial [Oculimacula yallundae]
NLRTSCWLPL